MNPLESQDKPAAAKSITKIYYLLFFTNLVINLDHGIIPAASLPIEESLNISDEELGLLGSLVYAGIVVMGILAGPLLLRYSAKKIIQISMITMMTSLALFTLQIRFRFAYFLIRFMTGVSQAPLLVYFPVWVDYYGAKDKTMWLTLLQGGVPFGVFTGYVLSSWQWSFYLQVIVMAPCLIAFILVPNSSIDIRIRQKVEDVTIQRESVETAEQREQRIDYARISYCKLLFMLLRSKVYVCVMLSLCVAFFMVTGVQFWISNYMETVLNKPQSLVNTVFSIVSITAPTLGCLAGGATVQLTGGYESKFALPICFLFTIFSTGVSLPIPYTDNFWLVSVFIWIQLFCGGASVPPLTGIMISSVQPGMRSFANSNTTTFVNLLGYLPAPSVFGFIAKSLNKRAAMMFLMMYPLVGFCLLLSATIIQYNERKEIDRSRLIASQSSEQYEPTQPPQEHQPQQLPSPNTSQQVPRNRTMSDQVQQPDGGTYLLLCDPEDQQNQEHSIMHQIFDFHTVPINPGVAVNQEFLSISSLMRHDTEHDKN